MTFKEFRNKIRRNLKRRLLERRIVTHAFGSEEWVSLLQKEYFLWPKQDRRFQDRRNDPRRKIPRRNNKHSRPKHSLRERKSTSLLTQEEIQLINELIQSDMPD